MAKSKKHKRTNWSTKHYTKN